MLKGDSFFLGVDKIKDEKIINLTIMTAKVLLKTFNENMLVVVNKKIKVNLTKIIFFIMLSLIQKNPRWKCI